MIPAFEYGEGVTRILKFIEMSKFQGCEVIISDDSQTNKIESLVKKHPLYKQKRIQYKKNNSSKGAVANWNTLLEQANGEYIMFLHHDEIPEDTEFFTKLELAIRKSQGNNIFILRCSHLVLNNRYLRYHMPYVFTQCMLRLSPEFILIHNLIGSPSNMVVRKKFCHQFNEKLTWLVDVEWIFRLLRNNNKKWLILKDLSIISIAYEKSITASLGNKINNLRESLRETEAEIIRESIGDEMILNILKRKKSSMKIIAMIEYLLWLICRTILLIITSLGIRSAPKWIN